MEADSFAHVATGAVVNAAATAALFPVMVRGASFGLRRSSLPPARIIVATDIDFAEIPIVEVGLRIGTAAMATILLSGCAEAAVHHSCLLRFVGSRIIGRRQHNVRPRLCRFPMGLAEAFKSPLIFRRTSRKLPPWRAQGDGYELRWLILHFWRENAAR